MKTKLTIAVLLTCILPLAHPLCFAQDTARQLQVVKLPKPRDNGKLSVEQAIAARRSIRCYDSTPLSLDQVGQLLWAAQGTTDPKGYRAAPSAGALYPLEVYLAAANVTGLEQGVYKYTPSSHSLTLVSSGDSRSTLAVAALNQQCINDAPATIVIAAVYERTAVKYGKRAERYVHMEVGCVAQNVYLQATALKLGTVFVGAFSDGEVKRLMDMTKREQPLCLMPIGHHRRAPGTR